MPDGGNGVGRSALAERLAALRARHRDATTPEAVAEIVEQVLATMHGDLTANEATLLAEVEQIGRTIAAAKQEIASLQVEDINRAFIPSATDELDAIVEATAQATNEILDCCETFEKVAGELGGEKGEALQAAVTRIYEACSFQDITGQRIRRAIQHLQQVEALLGRYLQPGAHVTPAPDNDTAAPPPPSPDLAQTEIDRLLG